MTKRFLMLSIILAMVTNILVGQSILLVPQDYGTIQSALNVAQEGDEIQVSPGIYYEQILWPKEVNGIRLIGLEGPSQTFIDGEGNGPVLDINNDFPEMVIDQATHVEGFTIQNGIIKDIFGTQDGAGMHVNKASPTIRNMVFRDNQITGTSSRGAGLYINQFNGELSDCKFYNNYANSVDIPMGSINEGAGLYIRANGDVAVKSCTFDNNNTEAGNRCQGGAFTFFGSGFDLIMQQCRFSNNEVIARQFAQGGGAYIDGDDLDVVFDSCQFEGNTVNDVIDGALSSGGGIFIADHGANVVMTNCLMKENIGERGSAFHMSSTISSKVQSIAFTSTEIVGNNKSNFTLNSSPTIYLGHSTDTIAFSNCIIANNRGPAMEFVDYPVYNAKEVSITNSTIAYNQKGIVHSSVNLKASNTIFFNPGSDEIIEAQFGGAEDSTFDIDHCIIKGGAIGESNIDSDPLFINENLLLPGAGSPALEGGTLEGSSDVDILGNPRPLPIGTNPDIGAYEIDVLPSFVHIKFFFDVNENGTKESFENYSSLGSIIVDDEIKISNFSQEGIYVLPIEDQLKIAFDEDFSPDWSLTSASSFDFDFSGPALQERIEFGITSVNSFNNDRTSIYMEHMRCGETIDMLVTLTNDGTLPSSGLIKLQLDEHLTDIESKIPPDEENLNEIGWDYADLLPGEKLSFFVCYTAPIVTDASQLGELYDFLSFVVDQEESSGFFYQEPLRCSYDPNDKLVNPNRPDSLALLSSHLDYTIRFQNTGNDFARDVRIIDTLDSDLDINTFRLINTSHPDQLQVQINEQEVVFQFDNINLPDSTANFDASNGFVQFTIAPKKFALVNTEVSNTAHIIFDFNPPIVTNTTKSILVDAFPVDAVTEKNTLTVDVFPNPTEGVVQFSERMDRIELYDAQGKWICSFNHTAQINLKGLHNGLYVVNLIKDNLTATKKIILTD